MPTELATPVLNVGIITADVEPMARFYAGCFGFEALPELVFPGSATVHRFQAGDSILRLTVPVDPPAHDGGAGELMSASGFRYLTLMITDMDEALRAVEEHGGTRAVGPMSIGRRTTIAQVRDPDGNWIELVQES